MSNTPVTRWYLNNELVEIISWIGGDKAEVKVKGKKKIVAKAHLTPKKGK